MSLRRLKMDTIDLYQLHRIDPKVPAEETLGALKEMQQEGKIRHIGLSEVSVAELEHARDHRGRCLGAEPVQPDQPQVRGRAGLLHEEQHRLHPLVPRRGRRTGQARRPLDQAAKKHDATVAQLALAWLLKRSPVMLPIPGTSSVAHLEENVASAGIQLTDEEFEALTKLAK